MALSFKRKLARAAEWLSGAVIVHPAEVHQLPERLHLRRLFQHFAVDAVFDVGANQGQYATQLRGEIGFQGHIVSFEPVPELAAALAERAAGDPRWHVEAMALDREAGPATFNVMASDVFSSLHQPAAEQPEVFAQANAVARRIEVMRTTLAIALPIWREKLGFRRPFLKMDTQGNDLAVFEGCGDAIREFVGLQSELSYHQSYAGAPGLAEALEAYERRGFRLSALVPNTAGHFPDLHEVDCILYRADA
jgi:FkbM family methyltransferase